ncbi:hypothetical protein Cgig2_030118 [Carnegiea gigantea]|uniref:Reverse transcriptase zinc-binding domain-containing protein n=1 Tax=Carnegiea gigantea TaxID=171969 RepID=A0A9Q1K4N9_9CARY|nr:hypothetical protein Cgig2_030118 [Carnegiea gigantea]
MGNILTVEQQFALCAPFTEKDIKTAIFSIPNAKSPGPDGFGSGFFKSTRHIMGGLAHPLILSIIQNTLLTFYHCAGLQANQEKSQIVFEGCFQEGSLPMRYLGVPVAASRLSKLECKALVEKIMGKIRLWATKSISFVGRAQLLNSVKVWGIGLKNLGAWHKACIAKIVWVIALKKDSLWVKWVHRRYLKQQAWRGYKAPPDCMGIKDLLIKGITNSSTWQWQGGQRYTVQKGYQWLLGEMEYKEWSKAVWARTATPRHSSTTWFFIHQKLPVRNRMARFMDQRVKIKCAVCEEAKEDINHLFFRFGGQEMRSFSPSTKGQYKTSLSTQRTTLHRGYSFLSGSQGNRISV